MTSEPETDIPVSGENKLRKAISSTPQKLFSSTEFGLSGSQLTKESDCYSFAIVICEVSGYWYRVPSFPWLTNVI
jgi:hypothetical protein